MNKKIAIFPIEHKTVGLVRYSFLGGYEPLPLVTPSLSVLEGQDISKLDGGSIANIQLHSDYKQKINESDTVYFIASDLIQDDSIYTQLIDYAKDLDKKIIMSDALKKRFVSGDKAKDNQMNLLGLLPIEVPIISIFTMGENGGQMQLEMSLSQYFANKDYHVLQIGSQEYTSILGCFNFPSFLFDVTLDVQKRILLFNEFIYKLCESEKPDLIILGVPDAIMKYNDDILNGLGIIPFIIQSAIKSDIGIVDLYYNQYNYQYLEYVSRFGEYRLDVPIKYFGISNTSVSKNADDIKKLEYLHLNTVFAKENLDFEIGKEDYTMFLTYDDESFTKAFQKIEQELLNNISQM